MATKEKKVTTNNFKYSMQRWVSFFKIIFHVPRLFHKRLLFTTIPEVKARRDLYYSTIFALSSAALAFLPQLVKDNDHSRWLFIVSILSFGATLLLVIAIHFTHILFIVSVEFYEARKGDKSMEDILSNAKGVKQNVHDALNDSFTLMSISARLDLVILLTLLIAVVSYVSFLVLNIV
jgi:hypothetical protein